MPAFPRRSRYAVTKWIDCQTFTISLQAVCLSNSFRFDETASATSGSFSDAGNQFLQKILFIARMQCDGYI